MQADECVVVKIGGSALGALNDSWWNQLVEYVSRRKLLLIHGWSRSLEDFQLGRGKQPVRLRDKNGYWSRLTDEEVLEDILQVSALLRARFTGCLALRGVSAIGLVAADADVIQS